MVIYETMSISEDAPDAGDALTADTGLIGAEPATAVDDLLTAAEPIESGQDDLLIPPPPPARPVLSPDGTRFAMLRADTTGAIRLLVAPVSGEPAEPLNLELELTLDPAGPQWSPDGSQLTLTAPHPADGRPAVWVIHLETSFARLVVDHDAEDSEPTWSPDGEWIAFLSRRSGRTAATIISADGLGTPIQVSSAPRGFDDHSLTWSRDSGRLAYARYAIDGDKHGDQIHTYDLKTGASKQITTRLCGRRQLTWAPDRNLIMHVADDSEWDQIAVVNADNSSGWNIAAEKGDKFNPVWSNDGQRVTYSRRHEGVVRVAERGTSTATSEALDPGEGEALWPQILPDKRVLYVYQSATVGPTLYVQEPKADAERTVIPVFPEWTPSRPVTTPRHQELAIDDVKTGALVYRWTEQSGPIPAVIVLRDFPEQAHVAGLNMLEQALAAYGLVVVVPTMPGTPGEGRKVSTGLIGRTDIDAEVYDLLSVIEAVTAIPDIAQDRIGLVGSGQGGALAMVLAGSRPHAVQVVAAVDPVCDWNTEFDHAGDETRAWILDNLGLPATNQGVYAVRTPKTFAGVIEEPLMLMGTEHAPAGRSAQLDSLTVILRDLNHHFVQDVSLAEDEWTAMSRVAAFVHDALTKRAKDVAPVGEAVTADAV